jgi:hypothetical protein
MVEGSGLSKHAAAGTAGHREDPGFGELCDAVAFRQLVAVTGSGVSAELGSARSAGTPMSTWHDVLKSMRHEFTDRLREVDAHLDLLLNARPQNSEYLIEAATLIRDAVGHKPYRNAVVGLTTPREGAHSALHDLIEGLEPIGIITFNYDRGHENAYRSLRRNAPPLQRAIYSEEDKLRTFLAGRTRARFLLKAHGCISRPQSIVLDRDSYRDVMARQPGYRAFVSHILARFDALIVGFGLNDPDFEDFLQTFEANFGGRIRDHIYIWKRGQREDEEARAFVLQRRYGLQCIFVNDYKAVRTIIAEAQSQLGPKLRRVIDDSLMRGEDVASHRLQRRAAHQALGELSPTGARVAVTALQSCVRDKARRALARAEAAYSIGKVKPYVSGSAQFLLGEITPHAEPEVAIHALAALLQLDPPLDRPIHSWLRIAAELRPLCVQIDRRVKSGARAFGTPRAVKYIDALVARWEATAGAHRAKSRKVTP